MSCGHCFKCREGTGCIRAVSFAPTAMPNRHPQAVEGVAKDKQWDKDMPAYQRIRRNGVQPRRIDDAAQLETRANDQFEIEMATIVPKNMKSRVQEGLNICKELELKPQDIQKKPGVPND
jgi:hypothetical protein